MSDAHLVATLTATLTGAIWLATAKADDGETAARASAERARPAVLIVPVWDPPDRSRPSGRLEVVQPRGMQEPPSRADRRTSAANHANDGTSLVGPEYELVGTYAPNPMWPHIRYYVYRLNLSDPALPRIWRELHRAHRKELRQARAEHRSLRDWQRRKVQLIRANEQAVRNGLAQMRAGRYRQAVISFTRAAELDHGDSTCRIHLAQARVAIGHDADAAKVLRRALELQPNTVSMQLGLDQHYPLKEDFDAQVDALAERVSRKPTPSADDYFLLGFMEFQRGQLDKAHAAFRQAARGLPKDRLIQSYLKITKPVELD